MLTREMLQPDQHQATDACLEYANNGKNIPLFMVEGPAGSGKTSAARVFIQELPESLRKKTVVLGPTNKSVKVARELSGGLTKVTTIFKQLRLFPQANGEVKEIKQGGAFDECLENVELMVVDEGSMIGQKDGPMDQRGLRYHIEKAFYEYGVRSIFLLDRYQLPPVGEPISWTITEAERLRSFAKLTKVKRHDNAILENATHVRGVIDRRETLKFIEKFDELAGGVKVYRRRAKFEEAMADAWGKHSNAEAGCRVLAWTNDAVNMHSETVREIIYGRQKANEAMFQVGERIVVCNPVKSLQADGEVLMHTDEEGVILKMAVANHPVHPEVQCYQLVVERDDGQGPCGIYAPTAEGAKVADRIKANWKKRANAEDKIYWQAYWAFSELMNDVRPCHSLTIHRSQGSTFKEVFVDVDNILSNRNAIEALRCLYVANTRPSFALHLKYSGI